MKPEKILESDMLDIIFENRNKEYGAYELRRHYNNRASKALGITTIIAVLFGIMQGFKTPEKKSVITDLILRSEVILADNEKPKEEKKKEDEPKEKEVAKEKAIEQPKDFEEIKNTPPEIVKDDIIVDPVPRDTDLEDKLSGKDNKPGEKVLPGQNALPKSDGTDKTVGKTFVESALPEGPISIAEVMPQFPGGKDAFLKFMQRNLRQPDDLEEGEKLVVIASFVVNAEGEIVDIDITKNGRKDLDAEVIRVIKKMPRWNPGMQNGRKVSVFYKVPVTFVAP